MQEARKDRDAYLMDLRHFLEMHMEEATPSDIEPIRKERLPAVPPACLAKFSSDCAAGPQADAASPMSHPLPADEGESHIVLDARQRGTVP